jgi:hypothetical protein
MQFRRFIRVFTVVAMLIVTNIVAIMKIIAAVLNSGTVGLGVVVAWVPEVSDITETVLSPALVTYTLSLAE